MTKIQRQRLRTTTNGSRCRRLLEHFLTIPKMICSRHTYPSVIAVLLLLSSSRAATYQSSGCLRDKHILRECEKSTGIQNEGNEQCLAHGLHAINEYTNSSILFRSLRALWVSSILDLDLVPKIRNRAINKHPIPKKSIRCFSIGVHFPCSIRMLRFDRNVATTEELYIDVSILSRLRGNFRNIYDTRPNFAHWIKLESLKWHINSDFCIFSFSGVCVNGRMCCENAVSQFNMLVN